MSDTKKITLTLDGDLHAALTDYANGNPLSDVAGSLLKTALGRVAAVYRYNEARRQAKLAERAAEAKKAEAKAKRSTK